MKVPNCLLRGSVRRTTSPMTHPKVYDMYAALVPGSNNGCMSAMRCTIQSQSHINSGVTPRGMIGTPSRCVRASYTVALSFPCAPNSGQIVGDGHSVIHQPALRLDVQRHCRHRLGDGEHRKDCVSIDLPPSGYIGEATPDIDDLFAIHIGHYLQADLAAFADGGVDGFLDHPIWVRCHSTPSRSFLEPPICPSLHNLSPQETSSLPYH